MEWGRHPLDLNLPGLIFVLALALTLIQIALVLWPTAAGSAERKSDLVSGAIEAIDATVPEIRIRTDVGKPVVVTVLSPELLRGLTLGDRVTAKLDAQGKAKKITKTTIPEIPEPAALPGAGSEGNPPGPSGK